MASGWNRVHQALGAGGGGNRNVVQQRREDRRDLRQDRRQDRRVVGAPPREYTVTTPGTTTVGPGGFLNGVNQDARDQTWQQWQDTVANLGGAPMSYTDYAQANNGGPAILPTSVNGTRMEVAPGVTGLGGAVETADPATFGAAPPNGGTPTVVQTFNRQRPNHRNNRNRR